MSAEVVHEWTEQELELLGGLTCCLEAGIVGERGITEAGDSWFVLERPDGSAIVHFGKVNGRYVSVTSQAGAFDTGNNLLSLVLKFLGGCNSA